MTVAMLPRVSSAIAPVFRSAAPLLRSPLVRAVGVALAWGLGALPVVLGVARCPVAALFHVACPGCGMTRAVRLLAHGQLSESVHMHPLALPALAASLAVMLATTVVTWRRGTPIALLAEPFGRAAAAIFVVVQLALLGLWTARVLGALGGPVPV